MILAAGGTGFVGAEIVRELARRGKRVSVLSRHPDHKRFPGIDIKRRKLAAFSSARSSKLKDGSHLIWLKRPKPA